MVKVSQKEEMTPVIQQIQIKRTGVPKVQELEETGVVERLIEEKSKSKSSEEDGIQDVRDKFGRAIYNQSRDICKCRCSGNK